MDAYGVRETYSILTSELKGRIILIAFTPENLKIADPKGFEALLEGFMEKNRALTEKESVALLINLGLAEFMD
jgi:hypothetical protein